VNNQIQADRFATEGFVVVMPDLFEGDPAPNSNNAIPPEEQHAQQSEGGSSFLENFKIKAAETAKSFLIDMWLARHTEEKVMPLLHKVIEASRDEFADAISGGGGIYAVGYCFGGRYVLLLAGERPAPSSGGSLPSPWGLVGGSSAPKPAEGGNDEEANKPKTVGPYIKAGALAHATLVSPGDFVGLKAPVSLVCVESDPLFPDEVRSTGEDYMGKNDVEHEVQVYPKVPHGRSYHEHAFGTCPY
jgi:dienelactone hydrolase